MRRDRAVRVILAVAVAVAPWRVAVGRAFADDSTPAQTFQAALAAYDAKRYADAIELFLRTYERTGVPGVLFNVAQSARLLGDCPRAVAYYRRFIAEAPAASQRPVAETILRELGGCGAAASSAPAALPPAAPAPLPAAPAALARAPVAALASPAAPVAATSRSEAAARPAARSRVPSLLLLGGAALLGGAGTVYAVRASEAGAATSDILSQGADWNAAAVANDTQGRRAETWSRVLLSSAAVLAAVGVTLLLWPTRKQTAPSRAAPSLSVEP